MADDLTSSSPSSSSSAPLGSAVIPIVNKLQDIFAQLGSKSAIEIPQVAVVGSQSGGKSSVLEALVGRDFLPRGSDICTGRPLVLQLLQTKKTSDGGTTDEEYGEFLHLPKKKFFDFSEIRKEIQAETDREVGGNKGVSDKHIRLKIYSPNVLDITLVDLPGITKVPVGDQPSDIEARIRTMILSYIKHPSCLILAVTPANSDLANSDALQIAGTADPDGNRTIGVITKLDIMDRGTDARNLLLGKVIPLQLGYVGVVNRCQEDIMHNRSIKDALAYEENFFRSRSILVQHIKTLLPDLKARISAALVKEAKIHASYGEITESKAGQGALLLNILSKYSDAFSSMVEGKSRGMFNVRIVWWSSNSLYFSVNSYEEFRGGGPCDELTDDDIRTAIQNATGPKSALFVPEVPFEVLVRKQIERLQDPSLQCARFIYDELIKISHSCMGDELQRFPVLKKHMDKVIGEFLRDGLEPSEIMVKHIIDMEMDYINTSHPNFIGGSKAVEVALLQVKSARQLQPCPKKSLASVIRPAVETEKPGASGNISSTSWGISSIFGGGESRRASKDISTSKPYSEPVQIVEQALSAIFLKEPPTILRPSDTHSEQEAVEIAITKLLLRSYYDIVRKNIENSVPKAICIFSEGLIEEMLQEPDELSMKRKRSRESLRILQLAYRTLDELPLEAETVEKGYSVGNDPTGLPRTHGRGPPSSSSSSPYASPGHDLSYTSSQNPRSRRSSNSGELNSNLQAFAQID
ncbi:hypothetical protein MKX01_024732 [Papaver californicum]|nr:hypothetical protein MKX01_024732 [Papaver californicum]